jgi:hypothetical protein
MTFSETLKSHEGTQFPTSAEMRRRAFDLLAPLPFDTLIPYAQFTEALHLDPQREHRARQAVLMAGRDLLREHSKKIINVRDKGYRIIKPNEHPAVAQAQQRSARRRLREALQTVTHVALDHLTPTEVAQVMIEQARAGLQVALTKRLSRAKTLPPVRELHLPSSSKLVDMMRKRGA